MLKKCITLLSIFVLVTVTSGQPLVTKAANKYLDPYGRFAFEIPEGFQFSSLDPDRASQELPGRVLIAILSNSYPRVSNYNAYIAVLVLPGSANDMFDPLFEVYATEGIKTFDNPPKSQFVTREIRRVQLAGRQAGEFDLLRKDDEYPRQRTQTVFTLVGDAQLVLTFGALETEYDGYKPAFSVVRNTFKFSVY